MTPKKKQNDSEEEKKDFKQLKYSAMISSFSLGYYQCIFDFKKCFDICKKAHQFYEPDKKPLYQFPPKFYILQDAETKIKTFQIYLSNLKSKEAYFYALSLNTMFMDIQDIFLSIFRRMEGILDLSYKFNNDHFSKRIETLNLPKDMKKDLEKLTTLRNKLIHTYGYAKPKGKNDKNLKKLTDEGIRSIHFNSDPQNKLIDEYDPDNIGKWVILIEILLDIVLNIEKTVKEAIEEIT